MTAPDRSYRLRVARSRWGCAAACLVLACAPAAGPQPTLDPGDPAAAEVLAALERILDALRDRDLQTLRGLIDPDVRFYAVRAEESPPQVRGFGRDEFLAYVDDATEPLIERIRNPEVRFDGPVALVWAAYDFHVGRRFSHCGQAVFNFVRADGGWRLIAETYTVRVITCPAAAQALGQPPLALTPSTPASAPAG